MWKLNCAVVGCSSSSSSTYGINKKEHRYKSIVEGQCPNCEIPYSLYCFPAEMTNVKERDKWVQAFKRESPNRTKCTR